MASRSTCCTMMALLVAFAVAAPGLPPSAAARDGGAAMAATAPTPSASGWFDDIIGHIGDLPLPRILPCPPAFPIKIPFIPCYNVTPPPPVTECRPSLAEHMPPCAGYLTGDNSSVTAPPSKCCAALNPFFRNSTTTPLCLCHVMNGDVGDLLPAPVNTTRAHSLLRQCGLGLTPSQVSRMCNDSSNTIPPMDAPSPPPGRRQGTKIGLP